MPIHILLRLCPPTIGGLCRPGLRGGKKFSLDPATPSEDSGSRAGGIAPVGMGVNDETKLAATRLSRLDCRLGGRGVRGPAIGGDCVRGGCGWDRVRIR